MWCCSRRDGYHRVHILSSQRSDKLLARACLATKEPCKPVTISFIAMLGVSQGVELGPSYSSFPSSGAANSRRRSASPALSSACVEMAIMAS